MEQRRVRRVEPERFDLFGEPIAPLWIIVWVDRLDFVTPAFDFFRRFLLAVLIQPFRHLLVAGAFLDLRFEIVATDAVAALSGAPKTPSDRAVHLCPSATVADRRYSQSREEILLSIFARCLVGPRHFRENATCLSAAGRKTLSRVLLGR